MGNELEGLLFKMSADVDDASKGIDKLAESLKKLKSATGSSTGLKNTAKAVRDIADGVNSVKDVDGTNIDNVANAIDKLGKLKMPKNLGANIKKLSEGLKALQGIQIDSTTSKVIEDIGKAFSAFGENTKNLRTSATRISESLESIKKAMDSINDGHIEKIARLSEAMSGLKDMGRVSINLRGLENNEIPTSENIKTPKAIDKTNLDVTQFDSLREKLASSGSMLGFALSKLISFRKGTNEASEAVKSFNTKLLGLVKTIGSKLASATKSVTAGLGKMFSAMGSQMVSPITKTAGAFGNLFNRVKRMFIMRAIRSLISGLSKAMSEGIKNVYAYSAVFGGTFKSSMDSLATSFQYLKNSMGAMVSPLIEAVAPAVEFVINKFVDLLNVVNRFFAAIAGKSSYTVAKRVATTFGGIGNAASGAAGSAKDAVDELKKTILGFDEINKLDDNSDSGSGGSGGGGGGSGSGGGAGNMFEEVPLDNAMKDWVQSLKDAFNAGAWDELGQLIGNKVNEIVDSVKWAEIGTKLGKGFDGAIKTLYYTLDTIDFVNIGSKLATLVNNMMTNIDFSFVGATMIKPFESIIDTLIGFLGGLSWADVGTSIHDLIVGACTEIKNWFSEKDWSAMGSSAYSSIKTMFANLQWSEIASSIATALGTAVGSLGAFAFSFLKDLSADIFSYFKKYIGEDPSAGDIIVGLFEGIGNAIVNIGTWVYDHIFKPFIDAFKEAFGIHSPSTVMKEQGTYIGQGILEGIKSVFSNIGTWINTNILQPIRDGLTNFKEKIQIGVSLVQQGWDYVSNWVKDGKLGGAVSKAIGIAQEGWTYVSSWITDKWMGTGIPTKAIGIVQNGWKYVSSWISDNWMGVATPTKAIAIAKQGWNYISSWINDNWMGVATPTKGIGISQYGWKYVSSWISDHWMGSAIPSKAINIMRNTSLWSTVSGWISSNWMGASNPVKEINLKRNTNQWTSVDGWVKSWINGAVDVTVNLVKGWAGTIKSWLGFSNGGIMTSKGVQFFANGGVIGRNLLSSIPKYAGGAMPTHGSLMVAGEAGAEVVGHLNGRTEVLNRSQMASVMYSAMIAGMSQFIPYFKSINSTLIATANHVSSVIYECTARVMNTNFSQPTYDTNATVFSAIGFDTDAILDGIADGVYEGVSEANARQNSLIEEQNDLLRQILASNSNRSNSSDFTEAIERKNRRDGKTIISLG